METTIHLAGDRDLKISKTPDGTVQVEVWNPMDVFRYHDSKSCSCDGVTSGCSACASRGAWPQSLVSTRIDKPSARLIASALLAAASTR